MKVGGDGKWEGEREKKISSQETSRYAKIGVLGTYMYVPNMNVVRRIEGKEREREREREREGGERESKPVFRSQ